MVDLIELAGLWVAAGDWGALLRTLRHLDDEISRRFPDEADFAVRFRDLVHLVEAAHNADAEVGVAEEIRRAYRQATVG